MDRNQIFVLALANVPTILTVLIGILLDNGRIGNLTLGFVSLQNHMGSIEARMTSIENRVTSLENKFDMRFDLLFSKVVDVDNRLTRIEAQGH